jgi:protein-L-isoaspartate(D-aspartate) O-methyltransferase
MASMLEMLQLEPGMRVLEIGAGTGYNAALLRELVGPEGHVVSIDIDAEVAGWARERLTAAGYTDTDIEIIAADGADGWDAGAPWDAITVTVGVSDIAVAWAEQLRPGGRLVLPLQVGNGQLCVAFQRDPQGSSTLRSELVEPCGFVQMRGRMASHEPLRVVTTHIAAGVPTEVPVEMLAHLLAQRPTCRTWDGSLFDGFVLIAGLQGAPLFPIWAEALVHDDRSAKEHERFTRGAFGLYVDGPSGPALATLGPTMSNPRRLELCAWGGNAAAEELRALHAHWVALGRPNAEQLQIIAQRAGSGGVAEAGTAGTAGAGRQQPLIVDTAAWRLQITRRDGGALS